MFSISLLRLNKEFGCNFINETPDDILKQIFIMSIYQLKDVRNICLTCSKWKKIVDSLEEIKILNRIKILFFPEGLFNPKIKNIFQILDKEYKETLKDEKDLVPENVTLFFDQEKMTIDSTKEGEKGNIKIQKQFFRTTELMNVGGFSAGEQKIFVNQIKVEILDLDDFLGYQKDYFYFLEELMNRSISNRKNKNKNNCIIS